MKVTSLKQLTKALRENEIFEAVGVCVGVIDTSFRILYQNSMDKELTGDHAGKFCYQAYESRVTVCDGCPLVLTLEDGLPHTSERISPSREGTISVEITSSPVTDKSGKIIAGIEIVRDITGSKSAEEKILHERDFSDAALNSLPGIFYMIDRTGKFLRWNRNFEMISEYSPDEIAGMSPLDFFAGDDKSHIQQRIQEVFARSSSDAEASFVSKSGKQTPYYFTGQTIQAEGKTFLIGMGIDITERRQAEEKINMYLNQLEKANRELSDFAYIVSHDLKEPLRAVNSLAQWILTDYADKFDAEGKEKICLLTGRVRRMNDLVEGILQYSRAGRLIMQKGQIDLNHIVSEVTDILSPGKNIHIHIKGPLPLINAEKSSIQQVFQNLIGNAIKHMDKPAGEIWISAEQDHAFWKFCVADNGPGIDKKDHEKIFQMFGVLQPRDKVEASGVGLAVVKKIVEMYGGTVWVEAEIGKGSRFYFTVPK